MLKNLLRKDAKPNDNQSTKFAQESPEVVEVAGVQPQRVVAKPSRLFIKKNYHKQNLEMLKRMGELKAEEKKSKKKNK